MSIVLVAVVAVIYFCVAVSELSAGHRGMALTWFAYAVANVGLICEMQR